MPEMPEVQTTVNGLRDTITDLTIKDVWTDLSKKTVSRPDYRDTIKYLPFFETFKKAVSGKRVISTTRRAKNILIEIEGGHTILVHLKMTGHLLYGIYEYNQKQNMWHISPKEKNDALRDPYNRFIHVVFTFDNGRHLALCDSRKFGKVTLVKTEHIHTSKHTQNLGPEILEQSFTLQTFVHQLSKKPNGKIKTILMDQTVMAGIGNIYSDEALWLTDIHPNSIVTKIPKNEMPKLFLAVKKVLNNGIDFGGDSMSDYRRIDGTPGQFQLKHNAYRLTKEKCKKPRCKGDIIKTVIGGRSAHFCDTHQKLYM